MALDAAGGTGIGGVAGGRRVEYGWAMARLFSRLAVAHSAPLLISLMMLAGCVPPSAPPSSAAPPPTPPAPQPAPAQIGRAHVCTPVTHAHLVCRLLLEKNNSTKLISST